jgi:hypothetical protein
MDEGLGAQLPDTSRINASAAILQRMMAEWQRGAYSKMRSHNEARMKGRDGIFKKPLPEFAPRL